MLGERYSGLGYERVDRKSPFDDGRSAFQAFLPPLE
jgi:hypothetical protein